MCLRVQYERADDDRAAAALLQRAHSRAKFRGPQRAWHDGVGAGIEGSRGARAAHTDDDDERTRIGCPQGRDVGRGGRDDQSAVGLRFKRALDLLA